MDEAQVYLEIAERALSAATGALEKCIHEKAAFLGYHAFEPIGGAFCRRRGGLYPGAHKKKLSRFVHDTKRERYSGHVATLAVEYASLRNLLLYPAMTASGIIKAPKDALSKAQAERLIGRTVTLIKKVRPCV
jgi:hypothetical protein